MRSRAYMCLAPGGSYSFLLQGTKRVVGGTERNPVMLIRFLHWRILERRKTPP